MSFLFVKLLQQFVQENHLPTVFNQVRTCISCLWIFDPWKQIRMVTYFSKIHQNILRNNTSTTSKYWCFFKHLFIHLQLQISDSSVKHNLFFGRQTFLHLLFCPPQQEWLQNCMYFVYHLNILCLSLCFCLILLLLLSLLEQEIKHI